ncbi:DUF2062 domain-containing protein [Brevibacillus formosus]|uniref:DUF2062 domain-containing protein n=1 Tax=Brevibacillus formosus TaxID=54913 RepID=UPI001C67A8FC|nr:DUF2062 domain-containing protein [Brevibacillus formosus]MBW5469658.1 DUF2062 domain-containing protein [Brevibacillus formosus]
MWKKTYRKLKYEYYKVLRMKGAPAFVARGFSLGIFVEFITLPTFGIAFLLLFPLCKLFRASLPAGLVAFVIGKLILPLFILINYNIGYVLIGKPLQENLIHQEPGMPWLHWMKEKGLVYFTGSAIMGLIVALASYFLVLTGLLLYRRKKLRRSLPEESPTP